MGYQYRGESPGKEAARSKAYAGLSHWALYYGYHIVVAGECGDIDYLIRQGVEPKRIIACDKEAKYRNMAKMRGVVVPDNYIGADIVRTTDWALENVQGRITSINVDLCKSLIKGAPVLHQVLRKVQNSLVNPDIYFTFLCGHDPGLAKRGGEDNPGRARKDYYYQKVGRPLTDYYSYQSWTRTSPGSPMCMAYLR